MQVQAAIKDYRASSGALRRQASAAENGSSGRGDGANGHSSASQPALAEGAETALLYVRFRAAAEAELRGEHLSTFFWTGQSSRLKVSVEFRVGADLQVRHVVSFALRYKICIL